MPVLVLGTKEDRRDLGLRERARNDLTAARLDPSPKEVHDGPARGIDAVKLGDVHSATNLSHGADQSSTATLRATCSASKGGTEFPSWAWTELRRPTSSNSSGNVKSRRSSGTRSRRSSQWKGPTFGPGCAWMVGDGLAGSSLSRKDQ